eukprot:TRINITY_DN124189_c0_g1_i1.p1 TRINITY_DN124189_c0_g1~~TRINITY_DN124189_c0_g1_i1.p1  ORF type:complete len:872 (+),score=261.87 TRINITY_DN124189_c0_g1_i1:76-2691(+)
MPQPARGRDCGPAGAPAVAGMQTGCAFGLAAALAAGAGHAFLASSRPQSGGAYLEATPQAALRGFQPEAGMADSATSASSSRSTPADSATGSTSNVAAVAAGSAAIGAVCAMVGSARHARRGLRKRMTGVTACKAVMEADIEDRVAAAEAAEAQADGMYRGNVMPITRLVGLEDVKLALRLACIDPSIGGVGICGGHGTAKTTLARSLRGVLPRIEVMKKSICNLDPEKPEEWDPLSKQRMAKGSDGEWETDVIDCPFIELPLGCTEDRLVGSLDVQASMEAGKPVFEPGLLAKAHRGILYIDDVNLLQEDLVSLLLTAIESGVNRVEREGLSISHPCRPLVIATWNPEEGVLRPHLLDRLAVALNTDIQTVYADIGERVMAVSSTLDFTSKGNQGVVDSKEETDSIATQLLFAREFLKDVEVSDEQLLRFSQEAGRGMCEGHRAEVFAEKIARAHAALNGRDRCDAEDVKIGIKLAIIPRARFKTSEEEEEQDPDAKPPPPKPMDADPDEDEDTDDEQDQEEEDAEDQEQEPPEPDQDEEQDEEEEEDEEKEQQELPEEFMIDAEGAIVDEDLLKFQQQQKKQGRSGARQKIYSMDRGRYVKAMLPKGGDTKTGKIALDATLRNAVVFQKIRREEAVKKGKPLKNVYVERSDIWVKKMARKAGALVIFIVDASGSMALNRMQNAKGAVLKLLESAYQSRDQVCLIPCRGISADVLVPPTSSVARASRSMQVLPCGGGTPLAHALQQALTMGTNAISSSDVGSVCVVAITDGRANVPLAVSEGDEGAVDEKGRMKKVPKSQLQEEVMVCADRVRAAGFKFLLIDTENKYVSSGIAKALSERAGGRYYYLPRADESTIAGIAGSAVAELRAK